MARPPSLAGYLTSAGRSLLWAALVLLTFMLPAIMASFDYGHPLWILVSLFWLVVLAGAYAVRLDDPTYSVTDVGPTERVDVTTFRDSLEACANCEASTRQGIYRRYRRQWVLLGTPLFTMEWGQNAYCPDCVDPDTLEPIDDSLGSIDVPESRGERNEPGTAGPGDRDAATDRDSIRES